MDNFGFWNDLFDTYQSLPGWLQFLWLFLPPIFAFLFTSALMRYRLAMRRATCSLTGNLVYSIHRDDYDMFHVYFHGSEPEKPVRVGTAPILSLVGEEECNATRLRPDGHRGAKAEGWRWRRTAGRS